ncbi:unnamed protein product [Peronospora effusa]|nr:unnamed protein product [Peronospora effusa]
MKIISNTLLAAALAVVAVSADMENVKTLTVTATPQSFNNPADPASVSPFSDPLSDAPVSQFEPPDAPHAAPPFYEAFPITPTPLPPTKPLDPNFITVVSCDGLGEPKCSSFPSYSNPPSTEPISPTSPSDVPIVMPTFPPSQGNPGPLDITVVACDGFGKPKCSSFPSYSKLPPMQPISPISPPGDYPPVTPTPFPDPNQDDNLPTMTVVALGPCGKIECPTPQNPGCSDSPMLTSQMLSLDAPIDQGVNAPTSDPPTDARRL